MHTHTHTHAHTHISSVFFFFFCLCSPLFIIWQRDYSSTQHQHGFSVDVLSTLQIDNHQHHHHYHHHHHHIHQTNTHTKLTTHECFSDLCLCFFNQHWLSDTTLHWPVVEFPLDLATAVASGLLLSDLCNAKLSLGRYWLGLRYQEMGEEGDYT